MSDYSDPNYDTFEHKSIQYSDWRDRPNFLEKIEHPQEENKLQDNFKNKDTVDKRDANNKEENLDFTQYLESQKNIPLINLDQLIEKPTEEEILQQKLKEEKQEQKFKGLTALLKEYAEKQKTIEKEETNELLNIQDLLNLQKTDNDETLNLDWLIASNDDIAEKIAADFLGNEQFEAPPIKHTIQEGDSLYSIAKKYAITTDQLITWNKLNSSSLEENGLKIGDKLIVSSPIENSDIDKKNIESESSPNKDITNSSHKEIPGWDKKITTDDNGEIKTHITVGIELHLTPNVEKILGNVQEYKDAINYQLNKTFSESSGGKVTASASFDSKNDGSRAVPLITLEDKKYEEGTTGIVISAGAMGYASSANIYNKDNSISSPKELAYTVVHELMHTLRLDHPTDFTQVKDTELIRLSDDDKKTNKFITTENTSPSIKRNILIYDLYSIDNENLSRYREKEGNSGDLLTPDQINFILEEIDRQKTGKGSGIFDYYWYEESDGSKPEPRLQEKK